MFYHGSLGLEEFMLRVYRQKTKHDSQDRDEFDKFFVEMSSHSLKYDDELYTKYILNKAHYMRKNNTQFINFMDEGDDNIDGDYYYILMFNWIVASFYRCKEDTLEKMTQKGGAKGMNKLDHQNDPMQNEILKNTYLLAWVHVLDNLMITKPRSREIFFTLFFEDTLKDLVRAEEKLEGRHVENPDDEEDQNENKHNLETSGNTVHAEYFLSSLFNTAIYFQKCIRTEIFDRMYLMNMQYYITLCNTLKGMAEDNFQPIKNYVGFMNIEYIDKGSGGRKKINYLEKLYQGIYINPNINFYKKTYSRDDRPDLNWYNIITLETISEYFNGPCRRNQERYIEKFDQLMNVLKKTNSNIESTFYELQYGIVDLILDLIEGDCVKKCKAIAKQSPFFFYQNITTYVKLLHDSYYNVGAKKKVLKNSETIIKDYWKHEEFSKHPALLVSMAMFFIMKGVSKYSKKYKKFMEKKTIEMAIAFESDGLEINSDLNEYIKSR